MDRHRGRDGRGLKQEAGDPHGDHVNFTKSGNDFVGDVTTLGFQARQVRIVPAGRAGTDNAPSHRVYLGRSELGAAWSKESSEGKPYLSLLLDAPTLIAPFYANLLPGEDGAEHALVWSRGSRWKAD